MAWQQAFPQLPPSTPLSGCWKATPFQLGGKTLGIPGLLTAFASHTTAIAARRYGPRQSERKFGFSDRGRLCCEVIFISLAQKARGKQAQVSSSALVRCFVTVLGLCKPMSTQQQCCATQTAHSKQARGVGAQRGVKLCTRSFMCAQLSDCHARQASNPLQLGHQAQDL
jgi:hypothetical protein